VEVTGKRKYARLPIICGNFSMKSRQGSPKVAAAMQKIAGEDHNFYVVDASDLPLLRDQLHFNAEAAVTLRQRFFDLIKAKKIAGK